jgi:Ca2+-transporting ATPase
MPELLLEKPHGRDEALISPKMWKHILTQALYQLFWLFLIVYGAPRVLPAFSVRHPWIVQGICNCITPLAVP